MNDPISINDTIIWRSAQIEGLKKQRDSLLRNCIYCDKCNRYYDKTSNCISSGIETRKIIRYNGDLEKGYTEMEIPVLFHICPLGHKMGESGLWQVLFGVILSLKELNN